MRFKVSLRTLQGGTLSYSYYSHLRKAILRGVQAHVPEIAARLDALRDYQLFGFSPLEGSGLAVGADGLRPTGDLSFILSSPSEVFGSVFCDCLLEEKEIRLESSNFQILSIQEIQPPVFAERLHWTQVSHSSVSVPTYLKPYRYPICLMPDDERVTELLEELLRKAFRTVDSGDPSCLPRFSTTKQQVTLDWLLKQPLDFRMDACFKKKRYYVSTIPYFSWQGSFTLTAHPAVQQIAYLTGFGDLLSQGFGLMEPRTRQQKQPSNA